jgi:hypothetical protein
MGLGYFTGEYSRCEMTLAAISGVAFLAAFIAVLAGWL